MSAQSTRSPAPGQGAGPIVYCATAPDLTRRAAGALRPYAAVPHDLAADPRLSATAVRVAIALLWWARAKEHCWPSDATIGAKVGRSSGTAQRALRSLEQAGWIVREKTTANRTGRIIRLAWRSVGARPPEAPTIEPPTPPALDKEETEKRDATNRVDAALLDRLKTEGIPERLAKTYAQGKRAETAERVLANVEVLRAQGRLTNPAGYILAGIERGYALLPAAAKRIEAERRAAETAQRNATAALERSRAEAERGAEAAAENVTLATLEPARLEELIRLALAELPRPLTRSNPTVGNPFVRAWVIEHARPGALNA